MSKPSGFSPSGVTDYHSRSQEKYKNQYGISTPYFKIYVL